MDDVEGSNEQEKVDPVNQHERETQDKNQADIIEDIPQNENESTPVPAVKRRREFGSQKLPQRKKAKSQKAVRIELNEKIKADKSVKKVATAKKGFKRNVLTVKFKLSGLQAKAGVVPDFALFVKDDVHDPQFSNAAKYAGKYISYVKGDIGQTFYSGQGIKYNPDQFFMCENELDFEGDKINPYIALNNRPTNINHNTEQEPNADVASESDDSLEEEDDNGGSASDSSDDESRVDLYNMKKTAQKVSWGAPSRNSDDSMSSGGVHVYGRAAEKRENKEKKKKRLENRKKCQESMNRTSVDILGDSVNGISPENNNLGGTRSKGKAKRGGKGGKGGKGARGGRGGRGR